MTTEDKELITLAAKAMGYTIVSEGQNYVEVFSSGCIPDRMFFWNPLTSADSHAMETELEICVIYLKEHVKAAVREFIKEDEMYGGGEYFMPKYEAIEPYGTDKPIARMRASLRVAAEIGRRM